MILSIGFITNNFDKDSKLQLENNKPAYGILCPTSRTVFDCRPFVALPVSNKTDTWLLCFAVTLFVRTPNCSVARGINLIRHTPFSYTHHVVPQATQSNFLVTFSRPVSNKQSQTSICTVAVTWCFFD